VTATETLPNYDAALQRALAELALDRSRSSEVHYQDERATIYRGDALGILHRLPDASVDAVVTDPPYSSGGMVRGDRMMKTTEKYVSSDSGNQALANFTGDNRDQRAYAYWMTLWLSEALRVTKPGGVCMLFTDWRQLPATADALQAGGWVWRGIVPWVKPFARPMAGRFTNQAEYVVWGSSGPMPMDFEIGVLPGYYEAAPSPLPATFNATPPRDREHITQKPVEVMRGLLKIVPPGGTVLDLFLGSGTTGVAAMHEGFDFIGSELVPEYADLSARRMQDAQLIPRASEDGAQMLDLGSLS
jgi:site-specific DNA-methyltransferase (adenine-specific)